MAIYYNCLILKPFFGARLDCSVLKIDIRLKFFYLSTTCLIKRVASYEKIFLVMGRMVCHSAPG